jgi:hypothetical protein
LRGELGILDPINLDFILVRSIHPSFVFRRGFSLVVASSESPSAAIPYQYEISFTTGAYALGSRFEYPGLTSENLNFVFRRDFSLVALSESTISPSAAAIQIKMVVVQCPWLLDLSESRPNLGIFPCIFKCLANGA